MTLVNRDARTVLFDLDGTLLPVDTGFFLEHYMNALAQRFCDIMKRDEFEKALLSATYETLRDVDPEITNLDVFARAFTRLTNLPWDETLVLIMDYYDTEYPRLREHVPPASAAGVVEQCVDNGWQLVLATQPLFPEKAVWERMRWCQVDKFPWRLVTALDNMHSCKPYLQYYREILAMTGVDPTRCVMVGNNMQEDMIAKKLGMKTYLVEDYLIDTGDVGDDEGVEPDGRGSLQDAPQAIERLLPS